MSEKMKQTTTIDQLLSKFALHINHFDLDKMII